MSADLVTAGPVPLPAGILPEAPTREDLDRLSALMLQAESEGGGVEILTWHHFADGLYSRTCLVEAGCFIDGAEHLGEHLCSAAGDITVFTEGGHSRFTGYHVVTSLPGAKRIGFAHRDTWWTTYHLNPDNCRDLAELERRHIRNPHMLQGNRHRIAPAPAMGEIQ